MCRVLCVYVYVVWNTNSVLYVGFPYNSCHEDVPRVLLFSCLCIFQVVERNLRVRFTLFYSNLSLPLILCSSGLKVLMVCFEDSLASEWYRIYQAMETVVESNICKWLLYSYTKEARTILAKSFPGRLVVYFGCEAQFVVALKSATCKVAIDYQPNQSRAASAAHLARSGSQSQRGVWLILPARGSCHIINSDTVEALNVACIAGLF